MADIKDEAKQRIIQEHVPGKQISLAHVIASPDEDLFQALGLEKKHGDAIGIMTITPYEGVIIAADIATKTASVKVCFLERFGESLLILGDVSSVKTAMNAILEYFDTTLKYSLSKMTHT